jgi:hypothetical protein
MVTNGSAPRRVDTGVGWVVLLLWMPLGYPKKQISTELSRKLFMFAGKTTPG